MKSKVKQAIKNIYSLMKKESKLNVKSVQQHIHDFKNKKDHYMKHDFSAYTHITPLRAAINYVQKEYKISGLCGKCQDEIFTSSVDESLPQHHNIQLNQIVCNSEEVPY